MMFEDLHASYTYLMLVLLLTIGLYGMIAKGNLVKKIVAMNIFQTAIYLFFIHGAAKIDASVPVITPALGSDPEAYVNPFPHVMILTAIVVGVAMTGVALAILLVLHRDAGSLEEQTVLERIP